MDDAFVVGVVERLVGEADFYYLEGLHDDDLCPAGKSTAEEAFEKVEELGHFIWD